jgi:hypothetical protein
MTFRVFLHVFVASVSPCIQRYFASVLFECFSKVHQVFHILQWRRWPTDNCLPQGFGPLAPISHGGFVAVNSHHPGFVG